MRQPHSSQRAMARTLAPLIALAAIVVVCPKAQAHFLWLTAETEAGATVVHAFLSEPPAPDLPEFMKHIAKATYSAGDQALPAEAGANTFVIRLPERAPGLVDGMCDLGLMSRGGETFRLRYTGRVQFGAVPAEDRETGSLLRLRLVGDESEAPCVLVTFDGLPAEGATVKAYLADGSVKELVSDAEGRIKEPTIGAEHTALLARWTDGTPGEFDGKPFSETRHYATLTVAAPHAAGTSASRGGTPFALLPEPINSFGGAVVGDWLYVYSGHTGTTHSYHTGTTNPHFRRLNLRDRTTWEDLPRGPGLQGVALVAHGGQLYRVGGMAARNEKGKPHDLISVADVARFDPESRTWTDLAPLPEPRSTHDAAVLGDHLYVVGGWCMGGGDSVNAYFLDSALRLDLTDPGANWETLPDQPFMRRALAVAAANEKVYVIGGLTEDSGTVRRVDIFDPADGTWSQGPELPGEPVQGFAPSAFAHQGRLYVSGANGTVYRLATSGDSWEPIDRLAVPRITHRLLPGIDGDLLIIGGNFAGVPVRFIESIPIEDSPAGPRILTWSSPVPGEAVKSQAVAIVGSNLMSVGGNRSASPHAFQRENLIAEGVRFRLDGSEGIPMSPLPEPRQSGVFVVVPEGRTQSAYLLGGIGDDGEVVRTLGDVHRLDPSGDSWTRLDAKLPDDRGMFGAAHHEGAIWVFGGSVFDPHADRSSRVMPTSVLRWDVGSAGATFEDTGHELPRARRSFAGAVLDGKYVLVGGLGDDMEIVPEVDLFDFATGTWSRAPSPERPRLFADMVVMDGKLYVAGGFWKDGAGHFQAAETVEVFDPATGAWSVFLDEMPIEGGDVRMLAFRGRLLFHGIDMTSSTRQARFALVAP